MPASQSGSKWTCLTITLNHFNWYFRSNFLIRSKKADLKKKVIKLKIVLKNIADYWCHSSTIKDLQTQNRSTTFICFIWGFWHQWDFTVNVILAHECIGRHPLHLLEVKYFSTSCSPSPVILHTNAITWRQDRSQESFENYILSLISC